MDLEATHYTAKYTFITLVVFNIAGPVLGLAPTMAERATLFVFSFFFLREFAVVPLLSLLHLQRLRVTRPRQLLNGIVHSAVAGGLSTLLVVAHQHQQIDIGLRMKGQSPSAPPDYRTFAEAISKNCAVVQLLANIFHVWRAKTAAPEMDQVPVSGVDDVEDHRIKRKAIMKLTGVTYLIAVITGGFAGNLVVAILFGTPVFLLVPVFFWLRDYVFGTVLYAVSTPLSRRTCANRWTSKVFESTLAGAAVGACTAALASCVHHGLQRWRENQGMRATSTDVTAFATSGAHVAMVGQVVVNIWSRLRETTPTKTVP